MRLCIDVQLCIDQRKLFIVSQSCPSVSSHTLWSGQELCSELSTQAETSPVSVRKRKGKKNDSQDLYLHSAEKGQLPSPDETVNPLDLKKVERVACRVSVQGGVSERVKWVGNLILFLCISAQTDFVFMAKISKEFCSSEAVDQTCRARR